jgi:hypothetical protein
MSELDIDPAEIGVIIMGLTCIEDAWLTEDGRAARVRLAHKLGAAAQIMLAARSGDGDE